MKINLKEPFSTKWCRGYLRTSPDGRKRIDLVNTEVDRTTISFARYFGRQALDVAGG